MLFSEILGLDHIKKHLTTSADRGRIPHAQLFTGSHGSGTLPMAIAYAQYLLCQNADNENTGGEPACNKKFNSLVHPDLHFSFPVANNKTVKSKARAMDFMKEWREFATKNPYGSRFQWYQHLGIENKQGLIKIEDAKNIARTLSLKSFEGGYKIMIIWEADTMNIQTSNYLLKLIEEPPEKTIFILISENEGQILQTIRSRCQKLDFPPLGEEVIKKALINRFDLDETTAQKIAFKADGNYDKALQIINQNQNETQFEKWFVDWVRTAFKARGNKHSILKILSWSEEIAKTNRETQKRFLLFCSNLFRQALLLNYQTEDLVFMEPSVDNFKLENFAPFVHGNNITDISKEIETAIFHIERNGNSKIILTDLSIKLTRLLHRKA